MCGFGDLHAFRDPKRRCRAAWLAAALVACAGANAAPDEILVKLDREAALHAVDLAKRVGARSVRASRSGRFQVLKFDGPSSDPSRLREIARQRGVRSVTPNHPITSADWVPSDPYYAPYQWNLRQVQMVDAWTSAGADGEGVVVAVLDTGVACEDFGPYRIATDFEPERFVPGFDFVNNDSHPNDDNGHGTHIAAVIMEETDNGVGVAGIATRCKIMPLKVLDSHGHGTLAWLIDALDYAVASGAQVINMSLTLPPGTPTPPLLEEALADAYQAGVVLVGAAGNEDLPDVSWPAASNYVIAVGASNADAVRASYSNYGDALDLLAPGGDLGDRDGDGFADAILQVSIDPSMPSTFHYYLGVGTSQAAAHVSAAAAILVNRVPSTDRPLHVRGLLQQHAGAEGIWSADQGYGVLQVDDSWEGLDPNRPLGGWQGFVSAYTTTYPPGVFAVVYRTASGLLLLLETPSEGLYGLVDEGPASVRVFRIGTATLQDTFRQGVAAFLADHGGIPGLLLEAGSAQGIAVGQLRTFIDPAGTMDAMLASVGATALIVDASGTVVLRMEDAGGPQLLVQQPGQHLDQLLGGAGGLVALVDGAGGLMALIDGAGHLMALVDGAGHLLGLCEGAPAGNGTVRSGGLIDPPIN